MRDIKASIVDLQKRVEVVERKCAKVDEISEKVDDMSSKVAQVDDLTSRVSEVSNKVELMEKADYDQLRADFAHEMHEIEVRRCNVVVHNMPEIHAPNAGRKEKFENDLKQVSKIFEAINVEFKWNDDVKFINRVGKSDQAGNPRPMVVGFRCARIREIILNNNFKLRDSNLLGVRVVPDLTKAQRDTEKEMERTCEDKNANLSQEDAKNFVWKVVGAKGQKRLAKIPKENQAKRTRDELSPQQNPPSQRLRSYRH